MLLTIKVLMMHVIKNKSRSIIFIFFLLNIMTQVAFAVAPSEELVKKWKENGVFDQKMAFLKDFHQRGGCSPEPNFLSKKKTNNFATGTQVVDTVRVLVLMVDFSDHPATAGAIAGTVADFDSILFSQGFHNPTGSMTDFYLENSYGNFVIQGEIFGWYRMPQTYAFYTGGESGLGAYPNNGQRLAEDAVIFADPFVDFSQYDFDGNGSADGIILIHSGPGAEINGSVNDIWSHKWNLFSPKTLDGTQISAYNMNPEEFGVGGGAELSPIGVFCHEYGHFLGLPDLYDTDNSHTNSEGLGRWSLMASGNYNGDSKVPSHFDAWSKSKIGFLNLIDVTDNLYNVDIPQIETSPIAYKLRNANTGTNEYFIVENRQKTGFDITLPGEGLLIYHIDETRTSNTNFTRYKVGLEQADGTDQLAFEGSLGDIGDPFPGSTNNREFHEFSVPNSILYNGFESKVAVWNISTSDSLMTADLDVAYSRPWIEPVGSSPFIMADADNDGILEVGESILFYFTVRNNMRTAQNVHATLTSANSGLQFTQNNITVPGTFGTSSIQNASFPIEFIIPDTLTPHIDSFYLTITTDSLDEFTQPISGSSTYSETLGFEFTLGKPNILIVDADRGASLEVGMDSSLYINRVPADIWDINASGTPTLNDILPYDMVLWHTGEDVASGAISAADIAVMKQLMDNGINLMLSTVQGVDDIMNIDSSFLTNYLHANKDTSTQWPEFKGVAGNPIGDNSKYVTLAANFYSLTTLTPAVGGIPAFTTGSGQADYCGITYEGSYKSVLVTFAVEFIDDNRSSHNNKTDFISKVVDFFGGVSTSVYDGNPFESIPNSFEMTQNYPNPFNPSTTIRYTIRPTKEIGAVTKLTIYNMLGRNVKTLVNKEQVPGNYEVSWDGTNSANHEVSSGIYFYRLTRGSESNTKKMTLLK